MNIVKVKMLIPILLAGILIGCSANETAQPPQFESVNKQSISGLVGQILAASDVSGIPDTPLPDQVILAFPEQATSEILGVGASLSESDLRFLKADITDRDQNLFMAISGPDGRYQLELPAGRYIVCLAESQSAAGAFPVSTRGCGRVTIPENIVVTLDISSGFGEVLLIPGQ